ncbi:serine/threonine protein kinase [Streptomyces toyocaensis]|uniref:non-specific serine/threonine protein kinase n=1 Tax=Streptomyces toyocaensis TaxID=55952 RepID=A0A081XKD8_STRTO|nr:serine/threonine-protein kinase [Streptomyces toyocaensis]KES04011.1 serine/threonine protein kinase [Streptomyces toyocaensis]
MGRAHVSTDQPVGGRYRLVEITRRETNLVSWYADDLQTGRPCLVTRTELPPDAGEAARRAPSRVQRATETVARLCPGRIATVIDTIGEDDVLWTVTAWIDGTPLDAVLAEQGTFNHVRAARIALELLDVLDAAHAEAVTHGELSPGQVFLREDGPIVVTGYGLAGSTSAPRLTAPSYASPEQARDQRIGPAADLWALGAILYTMLEGRPPFRDRGGPGATLRGVDRLPLRSPVRSGPLTRVVQGLLRKDARERLTRQVVREALTRVLREDPVAVHAPVPRPRLRGGYTAGLRRAGRGRSGRTLLLGTSLAVVTVAVAVLAATRGLPGSGSGSAAGAPPVSASPPAGSVPPASAPAVSGAPGGGRAPGGRDASPPSTAPPAPAPSPSGTGGLPPGYRTYRAPEGFSVALPDGWERLDTSRASGPAYRVTFGAEGDPRTLAVTYSERVGTDAVAVWRDDVEPPLERSGGYERIGAIVARTYQGREAADMEWYTESDGTRLRTFGRGFLLGGGRGFSLRWTTPAAGWEEPASREALRTFLRTFRPGTG